MNNSSLYIGQRIDPKINLFSYKLFYPKSNVNLCIVSVDQYNKNIGTLKLIDDPVEHKEFSIGKTIIGEEGGIIDNFILQKIDSRNINIIIRFKSIIKGFQKDAETITIDNEYFVLFIGEESYDFLIDISKKNKKFPQVNSEYIKKFEKFIKKKDNKWLRYNIFEEKFFIEFDNMNLYLEENGKFYIKIINDKKTIFYFGEDLLLEKKPKNLVLKE